VSDDLFGAPAGWYPDPLGLPQLRWWNNHAWTEQTSAARQPMVVQDTKFAWADDELPTRRDERERERSSADRTPTEASVPTADSLRELEPPRAFTQVSQGVPSAPNGTTSLPTTPAAASAAPSFPDAAASAFPAAPTPTFSTTPAAAPFSATPTAAPEPAAPASLYTPDPIVEAPAAGHSGSTFDSIFDARPATAPAEALDALFGERETRRAGTRVKTPIVTVDHVATTATASRAKTANTGPAWVIAMIPLFQLVLSLLLLTSLGMNGSQLIYIGILVVPYLLVILLAYFDYKALRAAGHESPAHWGWAALTAPVYLLLRARSVIRETGHGIGPVLVWVGLAMLHAASILAVPGVLIALLPAMFTAQIENSVSSDAMLIAQSDMNVSCVGNPPVLPGEKIVCESVDGSGRSFDITVTLVRSNGWIAWQVVDWGSFHS
jgi:hypothetical protein